MKYSTVYGKRVYAPESEEELISYLDDYTGLLIAMNAEKALMKNVVLEGLINSNLAYPDGIGIVMALRKKGFSTIKLAGAELWLRIIEKYRSNKTFYIVGSSEEVIQNTISMLKANFNDLNILGFRNGYIKTNSEQKKLIDNVRKSSPDFVFIAQGSPRQELLMNELLKHHKACYMGLGGSLDVFTGAKNRAPRLFLYLRLEWFYRLLKEPTRFKRQISLVKFSLMYIFNKL